VRHKEGWRLWWCERWAQKKWHESAQCRGQEIHESMKLVQEAHRSRERWQEERMRKENERDPELE